MNVGLAWEAGDLERQFANMASYVRPGVLTGSNDQVLDRIGRYVDAGADQVNIALRAPWAPEAIERLAAALGLGQVTPTD